QPARSFVCVDETLQDGFASSRRSLSDAARLETDPDVLNERPLVGQRFGAGYKTIGAVLVRRGEHLFRGHIWKAEDAVVCGRTAALPEMVVRKTNAEI